MKPNSKTKNIIHLVDRKDYKSILVGSISELSKMEIKLKEIALNLLTKSEYSDWDKKVEIGYIEEVSDAVFESSEDRNIIELYQLASKTNKLLNRIKEDNKR